MNAKTTLELPEELLVAAKRRAAEGRTTLRALIERGLRAELDAGAGPRRKRARLNWVTVDGGLPPGLDVADRNAMIERLRRRS